MYKFKKAQTTSLTVNESYIGETIEQKISRIVNNREPIKDNAPIIYTERKEGVLPATDIRTDRFEVAIDATDYIQKSNIKKREERQKTLGEKAKEGMNKENEGGTQPIQGTNQ